MQPTLETIATLLLQRPRDGEVLAARERATLTAAAEVLLEGIDFELAPDELARNVERFIGTPASRRAWRVRALLVLVEIAPVVLLGRPRFSRMTRRERARLIRERFIGGGGVWAVCGRIRPIVYLGAYASPAARRHVGWVEVRERPRFVKLRPRTITDTERRVTERRVSA